MVSTPNYQLLQPDGEDFVDEDTQLNDNWTKIDQDMNRFEDNIFTSSGTWTKPARCKRVEVWVQGGGASAGGAAATAGGQFATPSGGGGGGYSTKLFLATALASTETVDVGTGGGGAAAGNNAGVNGSISRFATGKAYVVTANGGVAGAGGAAVAGANNVAGGVGGTASGGDINMSGGAGGPGMVSVANHIVACGGSSIMSNSVYTDGTGASVAGNLYGGGSAAPSNGPSLAAKASLAGANGVVIVRNYF